MNDAGEVKVPGGRIHWQARGSGPLLMLLQSGDGDADRTAALVEQLAATYRVVTYDRRGLSRSVPYDPAASVTMETHADDAHRILVALTTEPAALVGFSVGALLGLHVAIEHPSQVRALIAHDLAAPGLLSGAARAAIDATLAAAHAAWRAEGWEAGMRVVARATGIDLGRIVTEPGVVLPAMAEDRVPNIQFFLRNDIPALAKSTLTAATLRGLSPSTRVVPAAGVGSKQAWNHGCAMALAARLGTPLEQFPGGHNGNTTHPRGFAARVRELL